MTPEQHISEQLERLETIHNVKIIYACEAGSRAWGFPSKDSDYDVRFIYVHPQNWYLALNIENRRDVIEDMSQDRLFDIVGWDLRKVLKLMSKSNPCLIEWLWSSSSRGTDLSEGQTRRGSPIIYRNHMNLYISLQVAVIQTYDRTAAHYHYLSMAKITWNRWLTKDRVSMKKYIYALRPLMAVEWISSNTVEPPPVNYLDLMDRCQIPTEVKEHTLSLIERKRHSVELDDQPPDAVLHNYIQEQLEIYQTKRNYERATPVDLNPLFLSIVMDLQEKFFAKTE